MQNTYCYQVNDTWYFRKKITFNKPNKKHLLRFSIKKLLGHEHYYKLLSNSMLYNFTDYLSMHIEAHVYRSGILSDQDIRMFIGKLLERYKEKAVIKETGDTSFIDNFGSESSKIEEKRFKSLGFFNEEGEEVGGHTPEALNKELIKLHKAYSSNKKNLIANAAKKILERQDIIEDSEYEKIPDEHLQAFREALLKIETAVLHQDINNYHHNIPNQAKESLIDNELLSKKVASEVNKHIKSHDRQPTDKSDDWDSLIDDFISLKINEGNKANTIRGLKIDLRTFKELMQGDSKLNAYKRNILDVDINDILFLIEQIKYLPILNRKEIKKYYNSNTKTYSKSIYYLIEKAKLENLETIGLGGMQSKIKSIKPFLSFLKTTNPIYKDLNLELWNKLSITERTLTNKQKEKNESSKKLPLLSQDLNAFLLQKYPDTPQGRKNFQIHTTKQPHIFFGFILNIYTGARAEEIAQLKVSDFYKKQINNTTIFYIKIKVTDFDTQSLKNKNSTRVVPLHNNVLKLGFFNYLESRIKAKKEWLFDLHINADGKRKQFQKSWNTTFKKWFLTTNPNIIGTPPTFHSLRDHFITKFLQHGEKDNRFSMVNLKKLVGHGNKDVTVDSYYKEDIDLDFAYGLINDIDFKIDEAILSLKELVKKSFKEPLLEIKI